MVATNAHAIAPSLFRSLPHDPLRDFAPVVTLGAFAITLLVPPNFPLRSAGDLLARTEAIRGAAASRMHQSRSLRNLPPRAFAEQAQHARKAA